MYLFGASIVKAGRADIECVRWLYLQMLTETHLAGDFDMGAALTAKNALWRTWVGCSGQGEPRGVWLASRAGEAFGMVAAGREGDACSIHVLWAGAWGRLSAVEVELLKQAETWGRELGSRWCTIEVDGADVEAKRAYTRYGYKYAGGSRVDREGRRWLRMHKPVVEKQPTP